MPAAAPRSDSPPHPGGGAALTLAALGVVFGDIGTSPLYAVRECFGAAHGLTPDRGNVLGVLSLVFWALLLVISVKYLSYVMRADNRGEGGILALMELAVPRRGAKPANGVLVGMGLFGAALLYGDGMITPAISVLSAVEGLKVATPALAPWILPLTVAILFGLFAVQRFGTARVGAVFGPVIAIWFLVLAVLGGISVWSRPEVLAAISPHHAVRFFLANGGTGFLVLGTIFLVVTGGEALYADMGHFGAQPIRRAWLLAALPGLLINYFGQGALLLRDPSAVRNPFYLLAPGWAHYPLVLLATVATVIASQAVISGAFSLTRQAVQLGFSPRMRIVHTSAMEIGQIYVPTVNWGLMLATVALVLAFGGSSGLAGAYGVAVTTTMVITTLLAYHVARHRWGWGRVAALAVTLPLLGIDLAFFGANLFKIGHGGWVPLAVAAGVYTLMTTWKQGRKILMTRLRADRMPEEAFLETLTRSKVHRVPGTAVFMTGDPEGIPQTVLHQLKFNQVLHERVVLLTVVGEEVARVPPEERVEISEIGQGFYRLVGHYGFVESPDIPALLASLAEHGLAENLARTTFFVGRETLIPTDRRGMALWRERLFAFMARNAFRATAFFGIPANRVVELGVQIEL